jgi:DNA-directed RNA polymerase specialized sigma subunit
MIKELNLYNLIANLIQELLDLGYKDKDLVWLLKQYGLSLKDIKERYGIPYDK